MLHHLNKAGPVMRINPGNAPQMTAKSAIVTMPWWRRGIPEVAASTRQPRWIIPIVAELLKAKRLQFRAAGFAEISQRVERSLHHHLSQFGESLVRRQIGVNNGSGDFIRAFDDFW